MSAGFIALARPTFDVEFAEDVAAAALGTLRGVDPRVAGDASLVMDAGEAGRRAGELAGAGADALVVFQATFSDSTLLAAVAESSDSLLVLWGVPEERTGKRLRLNSLCGINLGAFMLRLRGIPFRWVYRHPSEDEAGPELSSAVGGEPEPEPPGAAAPQRRNGRAVDLSGKKVGVIGRRPDGFEPCDYDAELLERATGISVDAAGLDDWFEAGEAAAPGQVEEVIRDVAGWMEGLDSVEPGPLGRSARLYLGSAGLADARGWDAVATRCWPECFTEFGGAACAPNSMLSSSGRPGCCEADVHGAVTAMLLQELAGEPALVADLVHLDRGDDTVVFWHCGLAPREMAGGTPRATIHSNRRLPLLNEFALRPGRITVARLSRSAGELALAVGTGEMIDAPLPFSGTSGTARLDSGADSALATIMGRGLEHHYGIAYGDHAEGLEAYAAGAGIGVVRL